MATAAGSSVACSLLPDELEDDMDASGMPLPDALPPDMVALPSTLEEDKVVVLPSRLQELTRDALAVEMVEVFGALDC